MAQNLPQAAPAPPLDQEVRFAIVLYGGVSLAIYINGVVQELLRLVRATSGEPPLAAGNSETVYRKLGAILTRGGIPTLADYPADGAPIRTRFMIDVISGTSAGGINGVYLAKALVGNKDITSVQNLWFDEGDLGNLLNDKKSYEGLRVPQPAETKSLLNSRRMYLRLLGAFDSMDQGTRGSPRNDRVTSPLADELDVFATTTDIEGVPVPIRLLDNIVFERRYRNDFHLRFIPNERNDFQADNNPFLAFATRCTSSFPFAFEPMRLCEIDEMLATSPEYAGKSYCHSGSARWQKFFTDYLNYNSDDPNAILPGAIPFPQRSFGDGGYLNNAPFSYAVDALLSREPAVPIDRKLIYVEPSPDHPEERAEPVEPPDAIQNSLAALVTIPGYQTIRNDLQRMLERNRNAAKINKALSELQYLPLPPDRDDGQPLPEIAFHSEASHRGCYQIRATDAVNRLALIAARTLSIDEESILFLALRSLIRAWRDREYHVDTAEAGGLHRFLTRFDIAYRVRRLRFLLRKLDFLHALQLDDAHPAHAEALNVRRFALGPDAPEPTGPAADLAHAWDVIGARYAALNRIVRRLTEKPLPDDTDTPPDANPPAPDPDDPVQIIRGLLLSPPTRAAIMTILRQIAGLDGAAGGTQVLATRPIDRPASQSRITETACDRAAANILQSSDELLAGIRAFDAALAATFERQCAKAYNGLVTLFAETGDAARIAHHYFRHFDLFDCVQFPMSFGTDIGEPDEVDIIRVAPEDAPRLVGDNVTARRTKLKGLVVAHFGAFLDRDWRVNDLLWGRLDAAERIITALLPLHESIELRDRLINEAQAAILAEFSAATELRRMAVERSVAPRPTAAGAPTPAELADIMNPIPVPPTQAALAGFMNIWRIMVPTEPPRAQLLQTLAKGTEITGRILDGITTKRGLPSWGLWLVTAGRVLWGLVEISVPRRIGVALGRYWLSLLLLIGIVLIVAGFFGAPGVSVIGFALLGLVLVISFVRAVLVRFIAGRGIRNLLLTVVGLIALTLIGSGGYQLYTWARLVWRQL